MKYRRGEIYGIQTFDPVVSSSTPSTYTYHATRNGSVMSPEAHLTDKFNLINQ